MPTNSIEAISEIARCGIATLKIAQDAHVSSLRAARDSVAKATGLAPTAGDLAIALTYRLLAQQADYATHLVTAFAKPAPQRAPVELAHPPAIDELAQPPAIVELERHPVIVALAHTPEIVAPQQPPAIVPSAKIPSISGDALMPRPRPAGKKKRPR